MILGNEPGSFPHSVLAERHPAIIRTGTGRGLPVRPRAAHGPGRAAEELHPGTVEPLPGDAPDRDRWLWLGPDRVHRPVLHIDVPWLWSRATLPPAARRRRLVRPGCLAGHRPLPALQTRRTRRPGDRRGTRRPGRPARPPRGGAGPRPAARLAVGQPRATSARLSAAGAEAPEPAPHWSPTTAETRGRCCRPAGRARSCSSRTTRAANSSPTSCSSPTSSPRAGPLGRCCTSSRTRTTSPTPTTADVVDALHRLRAAPARPPSTRVLWWPLADGQLPVRAHPFSLRPVAVRRDAGRPAREFAAATLTIVRGDLNYRRLVGDRLWPPTTPFRETTASFLGPGRRPAAPSSPT